MTPEADRRRSIPWRLGATHARLMVRFRYAVVLLWLGVTIAVTHLPGIAEADAGDLAGFVPGTSQAVRTEATSIGIFGFPLISRTLLVQRDPQGLSPYTQAEAVLNAVALNQRERRPGHVILGALPVTNTLGVFPSSSERGTTALTFLFTRPDRSFDSQTRAARRFADRRLADPQDAYVGLTGSIPARTAQGRILGEALPTMELATVAVIVLIVTVAFRSLVAPFVALGTAGVSYLVAVHLAGVVAKAFQVPIPAELEPLILALLLGVTSDYVIFMLTGMKQRLARGEARLDAARRATETYAPIVAVAGITVAAGSFALVVARSAFFQAFGPAMALAVLVSVAVALTLVPALLAIIGRALFWPSPGSPPAASDGTGRHRVPSAFFARITRPSIAALSVVVSVAALGVVSYPLTDLRLGMSLVTSLPADAEAKAAAAAASAGFAPGIRSPSVLLLQEDGIARQRSELTRLGDLLAEQPGVAGVVGPGDLNPELERGTLTAPGGDAARYLVVFRSQPLGAEAIGTLETLRENLPRWLAQVGLERARPGLGGDTAIAEELVSSARADLGRITVAVLLVNFALLVAFLRSLVAPVYLLICNILALTASLGAATFFFQQVLGHGGLTFYVPFAAAVLLLSLGSDYNIFAVGHVWQKARTMPLRRAVAVTGPRTTRAITAAGVTLAASFGMLALVPLRPFRELAFVMALGIALDALVVRSLLVPALLSLVGRASGWPWARLGGRPSATRSSSGGTDVSSR